MNNQPKVQKKSKSTKLNGFTLFAKELAGRKGFIGNREIERAKVPWNNLSESKKEAYKERAKDLNMRIPVTFNRFNSIGENLEDVKDKKRQHEISTQNRKDQIQMMIRDASDMGVLDSKRFVFVSTLDFYSDSKSIYPAEIAFAKFSLKEGVIDSMSIRIDPGELPIGSRYSAEMHSKDVHKYPLPNSKGADGEKDYVEILLQVVDFLKSEKTIPIFFTEGHPDVPRCIQVFENTTKILKLIFEKAGEHEFIAQLKIYPVDELFYFLIKQIVEVKKSQEEDTDELDAIGSIAHAQDKFKRTDNDFAYHSISCDFHYEKDAAVHCCLSRVNRYAYIIAKWCCDPEKYEIKEGYHYPAK